MFKEIRVWRRSDDATVASYRCFERLSDGRFCVQSADYFTLPLDAAKQQALTAQFVELLIEEDPFDRAGSSATLAEAIAAHDRDFANEK